MLWLLTLALSSSQAAPLLSCYAVSSSSPNSDNSLPLTYLGQMQVGEEVKFDPHVMVERLHRQQTFHQAQLENGDILLVQAVLPEVSASSRLMECKITVQAMAYRVPVLTKNCLWRRWLSHFILVRLVSDRLALHMHTQAALPLPTFVCTQVKCRSQCE